MGIPTSVSIGSMVNLPPTARSEDYITRNCNYRFREKPRNHYIFARGVWGDVYASRRGVVFLLYLAFIDRVKDPVPRNHYIFAHSSCTLRSLRYFCPCLFYVRLTVLWCHVRIT